MKYIAFAIALLAPCYALATGAPKTDTTVYVNPASTNRYNLLEGVALNAAEATRTATVHLRRRWPSIKVNVFYTYGSATDVTATLKCSIDGTNYAVIQSRAISAGVATLSDLVDTKTTSAASHDMQIMYGVAGCERAQVVFAGTGAGGSDTVNVQVIAVAGE